MNNTNSTRKPRQQQDSGTTADKVLAYLATRPELKLKQTKPNAYKLNSPLRSGSDSHGFSLTIGNDGEHGAWRDFARVGEQGSLYDLADKLGIDRQRKTRQDVPNFSDVPAAWPKILPDTLTAAMRTYLPGKRCIDTLTAILSLDSVEFTTADVIGKLGASKRKNVDRAIVDLCNAGITVDTIAGTNALPIKRDNSGKFVHGCYRLMPYNYALACFCASKAVNDKLKLRASKHKNADAWLYVQRRELIRALHDSSSTELPELRRIPQTKRARVDIDAAVIREVAKVEGKECSLAEIARRVGCSTRMVWNVYERQDILNDTVKFEVEITNAEKLPKYQWDKTLNAHPRWYYIDDGGDDLSRYTARQYQRDMLADVLANGHRVFIVYAGIGKPQFVEREEAESIMVDVKVARKTWMPQFSQAMLDLSGTMSNELPIPVRQFADSWHGSPLPF